MGFISGPKQSFRISPLLHQGSVVTEDPLMLSVTSTVSLSSRSSDTERRRRIRMERRAQRRKRKRNQPQEAEEGGEEPTRYKIIPGLGVTVSKIIKEQKFSFYHQV